MLDETNKLNAFIIVGGISFLSCHILYPNIGDTNEYAFFRQITDHKTLMLFDKIVPFLVGFHILLLFVQLLYARHIHKNLTKQEENMEEYS